MTTPLPPRATMATRPGNSGKKVGTPDMPRAKRSLTRAAAIENDLVNKAAVRHDTANQPGPAPRQKILRPRPEKAPNPAPEESNAAADFSEGRGSSDEYLPPKLDAAADPHYSDDEELMDPSADEEDSIAARKKPAGRSKKLPKGSHRDAMDKERVRQGGSVADGKRKAPDAGVTKPQKKAKKSASKQVPGGIRLDWDCGRTPVVASSRAPSRSRSSGSAMSFMSHRRAASSDIDMPGPEDSDSSVLGGIASDADDGDEQADAQESTESVKEARAKVSSLAGIVETEGYVHPSARRRPSKTFKKADIKIGSLPDAIRATFKTDFTPALLDYVGTLAAWTDPNAEEAIKLFNITFPDNKLSPDDPKDADLVLVVLKLAGGLFDGGKLQLDPEGSYLT
ncbi:hypothetical protein B0H13DRAFT_1856250 [Mycena leptocephala]|nr:hypothetical protein B0H13DRAFT_1856250 [Mycena leptocephala]